MNDIPFSQTAVLVTFSIQREKFQFRSLFVFYGGKSEDVSNKYEISSCYLWFCFSTCLPQKCYLKFLGCLFLLFKKYLQIESLSCPIHKLSQVFLSISS